MLVESITSWTTTIVISMHFALHVIFEFCIHFLHFVAQVLLQSDVVKVKGKNVGVTMFSYDSFIFEL